eukprot:TRINITY_DN68192_c4_g2_i1.p1 TRINITY_DN68192_c4_g2~~TRINITY_DN68192_c4_g2_i1.p1  ORF type:complete len:732 (-),score=60.75 TRINITY_DN68192_c4_g2_i1:1548-3743(-)
MCLLDIPFDVLGEIYTYHPDLVLWSSLCWKTHSIFHLKKVYGKTIPDEKDIEAFRNNGTQAMSLDFPHRYTGTDTRLAQLAQLATVDSLKALTVNLSCCGVSTESFRPLLQLGSLQLSELDLRLNGGGAGVTLRDEGVDMIASLVDSLSPKLSRLTLGLQLNDLTSKAVNCLLLDNTTSLCKTHLRDLDLDFSFNSLLCNDTTTEEAHEEPHTSDTSKGTEARIVTPDCTTIAAKKLGLRSLTLQLRSALNITTTPTCGSLLNDEMENVTRATTCFMSRLFSTIGDIPALESLSLGLQHNNITDNCLLQLQKLCCLSESLTTLKLHLGYNHITSVGVLYLSKISQLWKLNSLFLELCFNHVKQPEEEDQQLCNVIPLDDLRALKYVRDFTLDLRGNRIGAQGLQSIGHLVGGLLRHSQLSTLWLGLADNQLADKDVASFVEMLKHDPNTQPHQYHNKTGLKELQLLLGRNKINRATAKALNALLFTACGQCAPKKGCVCLFKTLKSAVISLPKNELSDVAIYDLCRIPQSQKGDSGLESLMLDVANNTKISGTSGFLPIGRRLPNLKEVQLSLGSNPLITLPGVMPLKQIKIAQPNLKLNVNLRPNPCLTTTAADELEFLDNSADYKVAKPVNGQTTQAKRTDNAQGQTTRTPAGRVFDGYDAQLRKHGKLLTPTDLPAPGGVFQLPTQLQDVAHHKGITDTPTRPHSPPSTAHVVGDHQESSDVGVGVKN